MTAIDPRTLIGEAMLAPSVHNVQPARWRILGDDGLILFEDKSCRLKVGDPRGNDAGISLGAAAEGLRLAASLRGLSLLEHEELLPQETEALRAVACYRLQPADLPPDPLAGLVDRRQSWRSDFAPALPADRDAARALIADDAAVVADPAQLGTLARSFDRASYGFMRDRPFRTELLSWMRLSPRHPRWSIDGLNAEAMAMARVEAWGAGLVLGPLFGLLDALGIARPLLAEGGKVAKGAALVVFHRPAEEPPFDSGRHFYRLWLRIEQAGFGAAVLAALADDPEAAAKLADMTGLPPSRRVVSAFRIGRRGNAKPARRTRRPVESVLV